MGFRRLSVAADIARQRQRSERADGSHFVIHDTSGPNYGRRSFPEDIDGGSRINSLTNFKCSDGWGKAHVVINRSGSMLLNHELCIPWRETKFEQAANFAGALKGLFLHVELISRAGRRRAQRPQRCGKPHSGLYRCTV